MGFFDVFQDEGGSGGVYIGKDEKADIIANGTVLQVISVERDEDPTYGERYVVVVKVAGNDAERKVTFPVASGVESRDRLLAALSKYLDDEGAEAPKITLAKAGRAIIIKPA